jgi:hypothetical protein
VSLERSAKPPRTRPPWRTRLAADGSTSSTSGVLSQALSLIGAFGPPLTVLTGLLVYFGWLARPSLTSQARPPGRLMWSGIRRIEPALAVGR